MEEDVWNQDSHTRHHVKKAIAKLAISSGYQSINQQPLNCLADLMERYIRLIGTRAMEFAEHSNHNQASYMDMFAALDETGAQAHFLRNLIDFTDPLVPDEVPKYPQFESKIIGLNHSEEIDENLPEFVYPWMPSIKATRKRQEQLTAEKAKEEVKEDVQSSDEEIEPPSAPSSAPGGARGADHQFPDHPVSDNESSCPPTPLTPAIPQPTSEKAVEKTKLENSGRNMDDLSDSSSSPLSKTSDQNKMPVQTKIEHNANINKRLDSLDDFFKVSPKMSPIEKKTIDDEPPGFSDEDDPNFDEPPGFTSSESEPEGIPESSSLSKPLAAAVAPAAVLPKPTSPKPISPTALPNELETESDGERKRKKKEEKKEKKKQKKEEKKAKKEEKKKKKKEKKKKDKKEEKEKKKKKEQKIKSDDRNSDGSYDSDSLKSDENHQRIVIKIPTKPMDTPQKKGRGRPKKDKPPKEVKPRGRPPKDPMQRQLKQKQVNKERGLDSPKRSPSPIKSTLVEKHALPDISLSSESSSSDDDTPPIKNSPVRPSKQESKPVKTMKPAAAELELFAPINPPKPKVVKTELKIQKSRKRSRSKSPESLKTKLKTSKPVQSRDSSPETINPKKKANPLKKPKISKEEKKKIDTPRPIPSQTKGIDKSLTKIQKDMKQKTKEPSKTHVPIVTLAYICGHWRTVTKPEVKPAKIVKKEPTKPIAKKEPQKLMKKAEEKKPQPPVVPAVPVSSHSTLPNVIDNTSKGAYIVMDDKGDQKIIDFGDEKVWICPKCDKEDDGTPMIGCDSCDNWYHNLCLGFVPGKVPTGNWYCPKCQGEKKKSKKKKVQKKK